MKGIIKIFGDLEYRVNQVTYKSNNKFTLGSIII